MYDTVIVGGQVVTPTGCFHGCIGIEQGRIAQVSQNELSGRERIDAHGLTVLPGAVDLHAHFNEPGRGHWEGWHHGSRAAAAGGVTTVVEMPLNAVPATTDVDALAAKLECARGRSVVDFALWGGLVDDNLEELADLAAAGVIGFKAFMIDTHDPSFRFIEGRLLGEGMKRVAASDLFLAVHAEDNSTAAELEARLRRQGRKDPQAWLDARPPEVELSAIRKALALAALNACPLHVVHVSIPEGIDELDAARRAGQAVTFETCVHYLTLTSSDFLRHGPVYKCAPPLRDTPRQEALWEAVLDGRIDCVTSDHSPCPTEDKDRGAHDIWQSWGGISGIQTLVPLLLTEGVYRRGMSLERLSRVLAGRPAEIAGIDARKGAIRGGADADLLLVDLAGVWRLERDALYSRHRHSPFVGRMMRGAIRRVLLRGRTIARDGVPTEAASGEWIRRPAAPVSSKQYTEDNDAQTR